MKPQAGSGQTAAAVHGDHGVPQCDRGSQDLQEDDVKESLESEAEKAAGRRKSPDSELGKDQAPSSPTGSNTEESGPRGPSTEQAAEGQPSRQGHVESLQTPEGVVRAHAAYTEQHLANQVQGLHLGAPRSAGQARPSAPPPHPESLGFTLHQAASQGPLAPAPQDQPPPQTAALFPPARAPSQVPDAVVNHPGWQIACQLLQSTPPGSWPDPALLVLLAAAEPGGAAAHLLRALPPQGGARRPGAPGAGRKSRAHPEWSNERLRCPQGAQQGEPELPSVVLVPQAGIARLVEERVEVAPSGGLQTRRLRPFFGIDLEKLPEAEDNVDKMRIAPRGEAEDAAGGGRAENAADSDYTRQGRSDEKEERALGKPLEVTASAEAPSGKEGAGERGRENREGVSPSSEQEADPEGGGEEAVEGGGHEDGQSIPGSGGAPDPTEGPRQAQEDIDEVFEGRRKESGGEADEHAPKEGATAESPSAPRSRGESQEEAVEKEKGDRWENSDAAGQQGGAERVGDKKGDRLRGGTRAEGPVMGAGPMEWKHERLGNKHWQEPGRFGGRERVSSEDPPKRKARDFGFAHQDVYKIRRRALQEGGLMASARSDLSLLDHLIGASEQSVDRAPQGQDPQDGPGQAGRGPYQCKLCGEVFAYSQALGGHMRSHKYNGALPPQPSLDQFQLPRPPPSQFHSFPSGARSSGGFQIQADAMAAALQALDAPTLSLGSALGYMNPPHNHDVALGLAQAGDPSTALGRPERERPPGLVNQTEIRPTARNFQHGSPITGPGNSPVRPSGADALLPSRVPSPASPIIYLPGQGAAPGGWFELEPVDIEHPERIPPVSIGGSPKLVAEQILEALVGYAERPTTAAVQPALPDAGAAALFSLYEPLSAVEQTGILDQLRGQQVDESRAGGGLANLATTGAQGWAPGYGSRGPA